MQRLLFQRKCVRWKNDKNKERPNQNIQTKNERLFLRQENKNNPAPACFTLWPCKSGNYYHFPTDSLDNNRQTSITNTTKTPHTQTNKLHQTQLHSRLDIRVQPEGPGAVGRAVAGDLEDDALGAGDVQRDGGQLLALRRGVRRDGVCPDAGAVDQDGEDNAAAVQTNLVVVQTHAKVQRGEAAAQSILNLRGWVGKERVRPVHPANNRCGKGQRVALNPLRIDLSKVGARRGQGGDALLQRLHGGGEGLDALAEGLQAGGCGADRRDGRCSRLRGIAALFLRALLAEVGGLVEVEGVGAKGHQGHQHGALKHHGCRWRMER
eukprot:m.59304 g.59304  ORF g.59304 m.59304 type:complete len:322 (-) comp13565_c0_seq2:32-997(-)